MSICFKYRGIKIRKFHCSIVKIYFLLAYLPFVIGVGFFCWFNLYEPIQKMIEMKQYELPFLISRGLLVFALLVIPALGIGLLFRRSRTHHGFMLWVNHRQIIARSIMNNRYYITERKSNQSSGKAKMKEKIVYFPKIYYQRKKGFIYVRYPLDLSNFQQQFLKKGKELEQAFKMDLMEENREEGFICFKFLYDVKVNRINIRDVVVKDGKVPLMKNIYWDIDSVPHALIVGGTGGGKTFVIYSFVHGLLQEGTVDICDPKQSDLKKLKDLPVFEGHIFFGEGIKLRILETEKIMKERFAYMESQGKNTMGNYREYGLKPHFLVIDEWSAYYDSLSRDVRELTKVLSALTQITLLGRQCGVILILAMQRPDQKYFDGGLRDNLGLRLTVGKLSPTGYEMIFAGATNDKDYYNNNEKGRGYLDAGTSQVGEWYAPFIDTKTFNIFEEFGKLPKQGSPVPQLETVEESEMKEEVMSS